MILIIGGGPAGIGAAHACEKSGHDFVLIEKNEYFGGHSSSHKFGDAYYDEGPHISFTKFPKVRELLDENAGNNVRKDSAIVANYYAGSWITHPIMANLGQTGELAEELYSSYLESLEFVSSNIANYEDWLVSTYGRKATELFFTPYTIKYWGVDPSEMSINWVNGRFFPPNPNIVKDGMSQANQNAHYVQDFYYPKNGGFSAFFTPKQNSNYLLNTEISTIDLISKKVRTLQGDSYSYTELISTIPLPELMRLLGEQVPSQVDSAARDLRCSRVHLVNIKIRKYLGPKVHWFYLYDIEKFSTRVTIQTAIQFGVEALDGEVDIQVEFYEHNAISTTSNLESAVVAELIEIGLFEGFDVIKTSSKFVKYANVIFDHHREDALDLIRTYLHENNLKSVGRFGSWDYLWSDESFLEGVGAINSQLAQDLRGI